LQPRFSQVGRALPARKRRRRFGPQHRSIRGHVGRTLPADDHCRCVRRSQQHECRQRTGRHDQQSGQEDGITGVSRRPPQNQPRQHHQQVHRRPLPEKMPHRRGQPHAERSIRQFDHAHEACPPAFRLINSRSRRSSSASRSPVSSKLTMRAAAEPSNARSTRSRSIPRVVDSAEIAAR